MEGNQHGSVKEDKGPTLKPFRERFARRQVRGNRSHRGRLREIQPPT